MKRINKKTTHSKSLRNFFEFFTSLPNLNRKLILILFDILILFFSVIFSFYITDLNQENVSLISFTIFIIYGILIYIFSGQYEGITRYSTSKTLYKVLWRNLILSISSFIYFYLLKNEITELNIFIQFWIISSFLNIGSRTIFRDLIFQIIYKSGNEKKVFIYGAGEAGAQLASQLILSKRYKILGFIDDNEKLWSRKIFNIKIFSKKVLDISPRGIDIILLAIPSLNKSQRKKVINSINKYNVPILEVPSIEEITSGAAKVEELRTIEIEELLGRESAISDQKVITNKKIKNSIICVTGAGGSIGSELCRQILNLNPKKLILIEISEPSLYVISQELINECKSHKKIKTYLGNVTDKNFVSNIFEIEKVDIAFHAAAYKHVPLVELNPFQGILNNYLSTKTICHCASEKKLSNVLLVSTDKAVRPTSIMGVSKRIAEIVCQYYSKLNKKTIFSMVRFGNVLGSSGSVVPLFKDQISRGGPLTLTDPEVIRYFMTIDEAVHLMIESLNLAKGGDVFLLDMGKPMKILDLAKKMINLSGLSIKDENNPSGDIEIKIIGLREGEKLYEELLIEAKSQKTEHKKIFTAKERLPSLDEIERNLNNLELALKENDIKGVLATSSKLVPEWINAKYY